MPIEFGTPSMAGLASSSGIILMGFLWILIAFIWGGVIMWGGMKLFRVVFSPYRLVIIDHKGLNTGIARFDLGRVLLEDGVKKLYWLKLREKTELPPQDLTFPVNPWQNLAIYFRDKNGKLRPWVYELDEGAPYMQPYAGDVEYWAKQEMKRIVENLNKPTFWQAHRTDILFFMMVAVFFLMMIFTIDFAQGAIDKANAVTAACDAVLK